MCNLQNKKVTCIVSVEARYPTSDQTHSCRQHAPKGHTHPTMTCRHDSVMSICSVCHMCTSSCYRPSLKPLIRIKVIESYFSWTSEESVPIVSSVGEHGRFYHHPTGRAHVHGIYIHIMTEFRCVVYELQRMVYSHT